MCKQKLYNLSVTVEGPVAMPPIHHVLLLLGPLVSAHDYYLRVWASKLASLSSSPCHTSEIALNQASNTQIMLLKVKYSCMYSLHYAYQVLTQNTNFAVTPHLATGRMSNYTHELRGFATIKTNLTIAVFNWAWKLWNDSVNLVLGHLT